jgi:glycine cleavage system H lipoate-binding protein
MEKQSSLASLKGIEANDKALVDVAEAPQSWPIVLTITAFIGLFIAVFFYSRRRVESTQPNQQIEIAPRLIEQLVNVPNGLYFDKTHTWAFMEQDGNVRIGIDDFLQHITGKLTKIKMKETGEKVRKGETIMSIIQDGKQLNLYAPISGKIVAQNELLNRDSSLLNSSPFFKGWVYQIEPTNWLREAQFMLMGETYREWLRDEFTRLKDFITNSVKTNEMAYSHVVLQDGGELSDNVLASLEPKVWEDFQTQFIDTSR